MDDVKIWHVEKVLEEIARTLRMCGFNAHVFRDREAACAKILDLIPPDRTVGAGGSITVRELELIEELEKRGTRVVHHWIPGLSRQEDDEKRKTAINSDIFLTSANAITFKGEIVNIDGVGNRVAGMIYGPKKVIMIIGINKVCRTLEEALWRVRNVATPLNARRLGIKVPCAETGFCTDCKSAERLCRAVTILERKPARVDYDVMLIGEPLGY
jgi:hypothetical protein